MILSSNGNIFCITGPVQENHRPPVDSPHKSQWCRALIFSLMCAWTNSWRHQGFETQWCPCEVTVMWRSCTFLNTLRPRQNGRHFPDDIFKWIFLKENVCISIKISLKFVPQVPINSIPALAQIMAWRRSGDKPLSDPMMDSLLTHICVTRPQWVKNTVNTPYCNCPSCLHANSSNIKMGQFTILEDKISMTLTHCPLWYVAVMVKV